MSDEILNDGIYKARVRGTWGFAKSAKKETPYFFARVDVYASQNGGGVFEELEEPVEREITQYITSGAKDQVKRLMETLGVKSLNELSQDHEDAADLFEKEVVVSNKIEVWKDKEREKWSFAGAGSKPMGGDELTSFLNDYDLSEETADAAN